MTGQSQTRNVAKNFWSDRPLGDRERRLVRELTRWTAYSFQSAKQPIFMLTLTCKQAQPNGMGGSVWLTQDLLLEALDVYCRRICWHVYGNAARRFGKGLQRFVVLKGGGTSGKQLHVHMLVQTPPAEYLEPMAFVRLMLDTWRSSPWGRRDVSRERDVDWEPVYDLNGTIQYVLKTGLDAVAWNCTNL